MFGETIAEQTVGLKRSNYTFHWTIAEIKVVRSFCIGINQWFPFPLVIFFPDFIIITFGYNELIGWENNVPRLFNEKGRAFKVAEQ